MELLSFVFCCLSSSVVNGKLEGVLGLSQSFINYSFPFTLSPSYYLRENRLATAHFLKLLELFIYTFAYFVDFFFSSFCGVRMFHPLLKMLHTYLLTE